MPVCEECGEAFVDAVDLSDADRPAVARLYRAVADAEPQREILEMIYSLFGRECDLRPPVSELNLARQCAGGGAARG